MSEPQENQDEEIREFESAANKTCIERQHAMEAAERTCLGLRIEIQELTKQRDAERVRADKAEAALQPRNGHTFESLQKMWEETHIELAQTISERNQLKDAKDKAEAACAEKDEILGSLASDTDSALQKECLCASISSEHGCPSCDAFTRIFRKANHALSSDCGRGYIPASELDFFKEAYLRDACNGCYPLPYGDCKQKREVMNRLESLRKGK